MSKASLTGNARTQLTGNTECSEAKRRIDWSAAVIGYIFFVSGTLVNIANIQRLFLKVHLFRIVELLFRKTTVYMINH